MNTDTTRVLLIEDNPGDAELASIMLSAGTGSNFRLETRERLSAGIERLSQGGIDALLLDLSLPDSQGLATFQKVHEAAPSLPIVLMSNLDDEQVALRAVESGAQDYLTKGRVDSASLTHALLFAVQRQNKQSGAFSRAGKIFMFVGVKGGVGATTVALNVASSMALQKKSVIIVELRSHGGTLAPYLNHVPLSGLSNLLKMPMEQLRLAEIGPHLVEFPWGLKVLFAPWMIEECPPLDGEKAQILLDKLTHLAEHIILDLPDATSPGSQVAARLAKCGALVLNNDPVSVHCGNRVRDELGAAGVSRPLLKAIPVNRAGSLGLKVDEIALGLALNVLGVVTPAVDLCRSAEDAGLPFVVAQPNHLASQLVSDIAQKLIAESGISVVAAPQWAAA